MITLRNTTGKRAGARIRYEYGHDLFGYLYLDVVRSRKHRAERLRTMLFDNPRDFICTLDRDLDFREALNYIQHAEGA
jgi:hypothetical protein